MMSEEKMGEGRQQERTAGAGKEKYKRIRKGNLYMDTRLDLKLSEERSFLYARHWREKIF